MLRPSKHSHPDYTVINISFLILKHLKKERIEDYEKLKKIIKKKFNGSNNLFLPSLNFLFLLGLIEYRPKSDTVEYLGNNENF
ncbi:ABC-three component system middle component 8 [Fluviispira sanaruensis]|uniref:Uncharacterized protein n=1 Tax=Fluviispira sanaruensis TaxID=2493639 RepID=A0A4P2VMU0_FLUSA|nr:ABC-three component system middle component 8 [Fluviispira sanaruensis]BBH54118.1 hypothetical protein JCM31447_25750 [Fluviispira sanaruensis]